MRLRHILVLLSLVLWTVGACHEAPTTPTFERTAQTLGEPNGVFPNHRERAMVVFLNRSRSDPAAALAACAETGTCAEHACYTPVPPLLWHHALGRAARFHAANTTLARRRQSHTSPCTLVADIGDRYIPGSCDGSPKCACQGGEIGCQEGGCTSSGVRMELFAGQLGARAENLAPNGAAEAINRLFLRERDSSDACGFRLSNGHRFNILNPNYNVVGVGAEGSYLVEDFAAVQNVPIPAIPAGIHTPERGNAETTFAFRANYYRAAGGEPTRAAVVIDGQCHSLTLEQGSVSHGTWHYETPVEGCARYFFVFEDDDGQHRYPSDGSLQVSTNDAPCALYVGEQDLADCLAEVSPEDAGPDDVSFDDVFVEDTAVNDVTTDTASTETDTHEDDTALADVAEDTTNTAEDTETEDTINLSEDTTSLDIETQNDTNPKPDVPVAEADDASMDDAVGAQAPTKGNADSGCASVTPANNAYALWPWLCGAFVCVCLRRRRTR